MCSGFVLFFPSRLSRESERSVKRVVKRVVVFPNTSPGREESPASRPPSLGQGQNPSHITSRTSPCPDSTAVPAMQDLPLPRNAPCVEDGKKKKKKTHKKMAFGSAAGAKGSVPGELQALAACGREAAGFPLAELAAKLGSRG